MTLPSVKSYAVFGGRLRSELAFPDLSAAPGGPSDEPCWELRIAPSLPPLGPERLVGAHPLGTFEARLHRGAAHLRLRLEGLGDCVLTDGGRRLLWVGEPTATPELARAVVLGPALAIALQQAGVPCLHGSAVEIGGRAVAFLAPKLHGKSTLAMALVQAGARLVSDDAVALDTAPIPTVRPGVHSVRLHEDTARRLVDGPVATEVVEGAKRTFVGFPRDAVAWSAAPLAAVYLLAPSDAGTRVRRALVPPVRAAVDLAVHAKLPVPLLGLAAAGAQLEHLVAIARAVPVYTLRLPRDLERLHAVARR
ncbi:MAG TPA: hypothetical protein VGE02_09160, partial [Gemmatimonadales bacterium]